MSECRASINSDKDSGQTLRHLALRFTHYPLTGANRSFAFSRCQNPRVRSGQTFCSKSDLTDAMTRRGESSNAKSALSRCPSSWCVYFSRLNQSGAVNAPRSCAFSVHDRSSRRWSMHEDNESRDDPLLAPFDWLRWIVPSALVGLNNLDDPCCGFLPASLSPFAPKNSSRLRVFSLSPGFGEKPFGDYRQYTENVKLCTLVLPYSKLRQTLRAKTKMAASFIS